MAEIIDIGEYKRLHEQRIQQQVYERMNSWVFDLEEQTDNGNLHERYDYE